MAPPELTKALQFIFPVTACQESDGQIVRFTCGGAGVGVVFCGDVRTDPICPVFISTDYIRNDKYVRHWYCRWAEWNGKYRDDIRRFIKVLYDQRIRVGLEVRK